MALFKDITFLTADHIATTHQKFENEKQLIEARKKFSIIGMIPFIHCLEIDEEYIIAAGFDKDITVYGKLVDEDEFIFLFYLFGHQATVTGLKICTIAEDKFLISSSEDGSIRKWSLTEAHEIALIETGGVISCLGLIKNSHAVICTEDGYLSFYSLETDLLLISINAHVGDPIKILEVGEKYIATASLNNQCCIKVWKITFDNFSVQAVIHYIIEHPPELPFSMALWNCKILVPMKNKVLIINIQEETTEMLNFNREAGRVMCLKIHHEKLITVSKYRNQILVDVNSLPGLDHFGTFITQNKQIKVIAANDYQNSFTIIIGGKSLVMWHFEWPDQHMPEEGETFHSNNELDTAIQIGSNTEASSSLVPSTSQVSFSGGDCSICKITAAQKPEVVFMLLQCGHVTCKDCSWKLFRRRKNNPVRCKTCNKIIKWKLNRQLLI